MEVLLQKTLLKFLDTYVYLKTVIYQLFPQYLETSIKNTIAKFGVTIGGKAPWDIQVYNEEFYLRVALNPSIGFGESFMEGWWTPNDMEAFFNKMAQIKKKPKIKSGKGWSVWGFLEKITMRRIYYFLSYKLFNLQTKMRAWEVGQKHYDVGNDLYELMLDSTMNYTCAYWKNATTLGDAQLAKMELIAQKLKLQPGMRVLDLGCGWGALAKYLAANYGVQVTGCTISKEQAELARERCWGHQVDIKLMDYRDMEKEGPFDRVVAIGLMEHVGEKNYETFFKVAANCMKDDGLFLCHTIGVNSPTVTLIDPWTEKHIFPNGALPYHTHVTQYSDGQFIIEDWHNMGFDYSRTLEGWIDNFEREWSILEHKFGDRFYRMWRYYLYGAAAMFRNRKLQLWQIVLSKNGFVGGYQSVR